MVRYEVNPMAQEKRWGRLITPGIISVVGAGGRRLYVGN